MTAEFPLKPLLQPLAPDQRDAVRRALQALLEWQCDLERWPAFGSLPDATPIVSLYAGGRLRGCAGLADGTPSERVARSFVQALGDTRFGGMDARARRELVAQVSYARDVRALPLATAEQQIAAGSDGLALVQPELGPAMLLPDVARDHRLEPSALLEALAHKAGVARSAWREGALFAFETERVVARLASASVQPLEPLSAAAAWLAGRVDESGVQFGLDPRTGRPRALGPMLHGRVAVLIRALLAQGSARGAAVTAKRWLGTQIERALANKDVAGWPAEPPLVLGTLALSSLAGLDVHEPLRALCSNPAAGALPWHAAQAAAALGRQTPEALWRVCVRQLEIDGWAPWTAIAAAARGDSHVLERSLQLLTRCVRSAAPYRGGVGPGVPELARTAATVEALALVPAGSARTAIQDALDFMLRHQLSSSEYAPAGTPDWVDGAFPISPVIDFLQIDVTAHALLALVAARSRSVHRPSLGSAHGPTARAGEPE